MSESPSWLNTPAPAPAPSPSAAAPTIDPLSIESSTTENAAAAGTSGTGAGDEKDLPSIILMMRLLNMGAAVALISLSVSRIKDC